MKPLTFVTTNDNKFGAGQHVMEQFGLTMTRSQLEFEEIQAGGEAIARHKAQQAFAALGTPVVVTDDSWSITGLKGFPGAYMKDMNNWLTAEDWLRLTAPLTDREIMLQQHIVYQDTAGQQYFVADTPGILLTEARGTNQHTCLMIISFDGGRSSRAEELEDGQRGLTVAKTAWHDLAEWLTKTHA